MNAHIAIKDGRYPIMLDKERHLLFSLNAIAEIEEKFGGFDKLDQKLSGKDGIKNLRWLLALLLNEGADDGDSELTERQVGKLIHAGNLTEITGMIYRAFSLGSRGTADIESLPADEDDDGKNGIAGEVK